MIHRRHFLQGLAAAVAINPSSAQEAKSNIASVKALVFDTFGTVVDWRGSIIAEGNAWGKAKGVTVDWARFADRWRQGYAPAMDKVRKGELPWTKLDVLHRMILDSILPEFGLTNLTEEEKDHWNRVWHRRAGTERGAGNDPHRAADQDLLSHHHLRDRPATGVVRQGRHQSHQ